MFSQLIIHSCPSESHGVFLGGLMTDFTFSPADFNATEVTVVANTTDAKKYLAERYGFACVSINIRKSAMPEFADSFQFQGLTYQ